MTRKMAIPYVSFVVDDAGNGSSDHSNGYAVVRTAGKEWKHCSRLVGWQCGFEPLFVAVHSYLDVAINDDEAEELATDYLEERGWFGDNKRPADYIL